MSEIEKCYVVWSNEHAAWWGPDHKGYFSSLEYAGLYNREDALSICKGSRGGRLYNKNPSELPILFIDAKVFWPDAPTPDRRMTDDESRRVR